MPSKGARVAGSQSDQVLSWLAAHPGDHRPTEIAQGLGWADDPRGTHKVAIAARGLALRNLVVRGKRSARNDGRPHNTYGITPTGAAKAAEPVGAVGQDQHTT